MILKEKYMKFIVENNQLRSQQLASTSTIVPIISMPSSLVEAFPSDRESLHTEIKELK